MIIADNCYMYMYNNNYSHLLIEYFFSGCDNFFVAVEAEVCKT